MDGVIRQGGRSYIFVCVCIIMSLCASLHNLLLSPFVSLHAALQYVVHMCILYFCHFCHFIAVFLCFMAVFLK